MTILTLDHILQADDKLHQKALAERTMMVRYPIDNDPAGVEGIIKESPKILEQWLGIQKADPKNHGSRLRNCGLCLAFLESAGSSAQFVGVYRNDSVGNPKELKDEDDYYAHMPEKLRALYQKHNEGKEWEARWFFRLQKESWLEDLDWRLVVDWGQDQNWVRPYKPMQVLEIQPKDTAPSG